MPQLDWANLGFQYRDTNSHIEFTWRDGAWDAGRLVSDPYLKLSIAASALHYGQAAFEGLKVFRCKDGKVRVFRPQANAERMQRTAVRTYMPPVPTEMFLDAINRVVLDNLDYIPPYGTGGSLYIRPLLIGSGAQIGVAPAHEYTFLILVTPAGNYYKGGLKPVKAIIYDEYDRAAPHGMGDVKVAGNYAASLFAHERAKKEGFPVELYLDAKTHTCVEEFATSNFIGIKKGVYVTPDSCSVLPSVTNNTLKQIAVDLGMPVETRPVHFDELKDFDEIAACGTAVVVTPVSTIVRGSTVINVPSGPDACGPVFEKLFHTVQGIQYGELPDQHNWCVEIK